MSDRGKLVQFGPRARHDNELDGVDYDYMLAEPEPLDWVVENTFLTETVGLISGNGGAGKCLGGGTPVLMFDGSVVPVESIKNGDILIGPDSMPRTVRGVTSGVGPLYRVTPVKGEPYVVNANHVLSLKLWAKSKQRQFDFPVNLSIRQFLGLHKEKQRALMGWRSGVEWPARPVKISPYLMGLWLGDGTAGQPDITSADGEETVIPARSEFAAGTDLYVRSFKREDTGLASTYRLRGPRRDRTYQNPFVEALRGYGIYTEKAIPEEYIANSAEVRLGVLAGLIDSDGHLSNGCYEITQKRQGLADQIAFIAQSLGFSAYVKTTMKRSQVSELRPYYRVSIAGDVARIPVRLKYKKAALRQQKKRVTVTSIKVEPIGEGPYYGFEVDGDHLFLLGDFTVTHNSTLMMQLATCATMGLPWLGIKVKPMKALMLCCEDDRRIVRLRQRWINRALGYDMADVLDAGLDVIPRSGMDNRLMEIDRERSSPSYWRMKRTPLMDQLITRCRRTGIQLLIIDTVSKTFAGRNFDELQVTDYVDEMARLAVLIRGVVLLTQHPSMSGRRSGTGEAGSVQWEAAVRSRLYVHKHQALGLIIENMKSNYGAKAPPLKIEWRRGVFEPIEPAPPRDYSEPGRD